MTVEQVGSNDCNAKELARLLVGSIQKLLTLEQWNSFTRLQAIDDPFKFIEEVAKHSDALEKEDESRGNYHIRITGLTAEGKESKINCIKLIRSMMGWGLADSKYSYEALSGSGAMISNRNFTIVSRAFVSMESMQESFEWKEFVTNKHLFVYDTPRLQNIEASKPFNPQNPNY